MNLIAKNEDGSNRHSSIKSFTFNYDTDSVTIELCSIAINFQEYDKEPHYMTRAISAAHKIQMLKYYGWIHDTIRFEVPLTKIDEFSRMVDTESIRGVFSELGT